MKQTFTLNRSGLVQLTAKSPNQCKVKGHMDYEYQVRITCPTKLDKNGFVIDHIIIHEIVAKVFKKKSTSCEELCILVEKQLRKTLAEFGVIMFKSYIRIRPLSSMEEIRAFMELETEYF